MCGAQKELGFWNLKNGHSALLGIRSWGWTAHEDKLMRLIMPFALWPELKPYLRCTGELFRGFCLSLFSNRGSSYSVEWITGKWTRQLHLVHLKGYEGTTCTASKAFSPLHTETPVLKRSHPRRSREVLRTGVSIHDLSGDLEMDQKGKDWEQENQSGDDLPSPMVYGLPNKAQG